MTWWAAILFVTPAQAGLFGNGAPSRIPIPARIFVASVEDVDGIVVDVERLTFDGEVFLYGTVGRAQVTVPFEQIVEITFVPGSDEEHRLAVIRLRNRPDGAPEIRVTVDAALPFYGQAHFGNYRLDVVDARRITLR